MTKVVRLAALLFVTLLLGCGGGGTEMQKPNEFEPPPSEGPQGGGDLPQPEAPIPPPS